MVAITSLYYLSNDLGRYISETHSELLVTYPKASFKCPKRKEVQPLHTKAVIPVTKSQAH